MFNRRLLLLRHVGTGRRGGLKPGRKGGLKNHILGLRRPRKLEKSGDAKGTGQRQKKGAVRNVGKGFTVKKEAWDRSPGGRSPEAQAA